MIDPPLPPPFSCEKVLNISIICCTPYLLSPMGNVISICWSDKTTHLSCVVSYRVSCIQLGLRSAVYCVPITYIISLTGDKIYGDATPTDCAV